MDLIHQIVLCCFGATALAWLLPSKWQMPAVAILTALFLAWKAPLSLALLGLTMTLTYGLLQSGRGRGVRVLVIIVHLVAVFAYFKTGFSLLVDSPAQILIPLGLSYYSFRQIHYALEALKGHLPAHTFSDYACYLFFLPTFLVGPINRFGDFYRDSGRRRWDSRLFSYGLQRILYGYVMVVFVGNFLLTYRLGSRIDYYEYINQWRIAAYLDSLQFTLNAYVQFSGYSSVAIGLSALMGIRIIENFNYPFFARNINDFWRRWHISLSSWCRDYVYTPIVALTRRPFLAIFASMSVLGLWHEISLRYIAWAMTHVIAIMIYQKCAPFVARVESVNGVSRVLVGVMSRVLTFHFVVFSFILVKGTSWDDVGETFQHLLGL